jgi:serine/threonine protein kinase
MSYFDCKELKKEGIEHYFNNLRVIGSGAYGTVYSANSKLEAYKEIGADLPSTVALKKLTISPEQREILLNELQIMKHLDSPWTMKYYGCFESASLIYIVSELVPGRELFDCIVDRLLTPHQMDIIASKLAQAITYLHSIGFIHRDLKPENIMFDTTTNSLMLIDYGLACFHSKVPTLGKCDGVAGSPGYFDPVLLNSGNIEINNLILSDWWSYGQIVFVVYTGIPLWGPPPGGGPDRYESFEDTITSYPPLVNEIPLRFQYILSKLTNPHLDQHERPSPHEILTTFTSTATLPTTDEAIAHLSP